jgi:hypothetical protein
MAIYGLTHRATRRLIPAVLLAAVVCGCQTPMEVRSAFGTGVNYAHFGSGFAWCPASEGDGQSHHARNATFDGFLRTTIADGFQARGYKPQTGGTPDLLIDYQIVRKSMGGLRHSQFVPVYEEGSLVIDVLNGQNRQHVWRGYATAQLDEGAPPAEQKRKVAEAVRRILERFPREGTQ